MSAGSVRYGKTTPVLDRNGDGAMNEYMKMLLHMLRASEKKLAQLGDLQTSGDSPFRVAALRAMTEDVARLKVQVFDAMRPLIEATEK